MKLGSRCTILVAVVTAIVCVLSLVSAAGQGPQLSDNVFKNVQVLKGIPVDEFMDTMGMFASSLGYDCTSCHASGISANRELFAVATPAIQKARTMVVMMNAINRTNFGGEPRVSCFTCHRGHYRPEIVPSLALQYGELIDDPNSIVILPDRQASADQVFRQVCSSARWSSAPGRIHQLCRRGDVLRVQYRWGAGPSGDLCQGSGSANPDHSYARRKQRQDVTMAATVG